MWKQIITLFALLIGTPLLLAQLDADFQSVPTCPPNDFDCHCNRFQDLIGGNQTVLSRGGTQICQVSLRRPDFVPSIFGIPSHSPLVQDAVYTFERLQNGTALCLAVVPLLPQEANPYTDFIDDDDDDPDDDDDDVFAESGFIIASVSSHWENIQPEVVYVKYQYLGNPSFFAFRTRRAANVTQVGRIEGSEPIVPPIIGVDDDDDDDDATPSPQPSPSPQPAPSPQDDDDDFDDDVPPPQPAPPSPPPQGDDPDDDDDPNDDDGPDDDDNK